MQGSLAAGPGGPSKRHKWRERTVVAEGLGTNNRDLQIMSRKQETAPPLSPTTPGARKDRLCRASCAPALRAWLGLAEACRPGPPAREMSSQGMTRDRTPSTTLPVARDLYDHFPARDPVKDRGVASDVITSEYLVFVPVRGTQFLKPLSLRSSESVLCVSLR